MGNLCLRQSLAAFLGEVSLSQCVREVPAHCHRKAHAIFTSVSHKVCKWAQFAARLCVMFTATK